MSFRQKLYSPEEALALLTAEIDESDDEVSEDGENELISEAAVEGKND